MIKHQRYNSGPKKVFVDIDETICFYDGDRIYENAIPSVENISKVNKLYDDGCEITYWTARGSVSGLDYFKLTERQINEWGCKYHYLRVGDKPPYDLLICDKTMRIEEI